MLADPLNSIAPDALRTIHLAKGAAVFRQGDVTRGLFHVQKGQIHLQRMTEAGHLVTLHRAIGQTLFAEASLFSDSYHCDAICMVPSIVTCIDKVSVRTRMETDAAFAQAFSKLLAQQVQSYRQMLEILAIRSARQRILVAASAGYLTGPVTQFASRIGLSHEACYRALRGLCNEGVVIQTARGRYVLAAGTG